MRTIKFRAWHKVDHYWIEHDDLFAVTHLKYQNPFSRDDLEVCQFTGLLDKNGKEIYEGDLLNQLMYPPNPITGNYDSKPIFEDKNIIQVGFEDGYFTDCYGSYLWRLICNIKDGNKTDYEIIGNIYENPELIK